MLRGLKFLIEYILSVAKVTLLFLVALFLPRVFISYRALNPAAPEPLTSSFKLGLENISDTFFAHLVDERGKPCRIALITNHTGKDQFGKRNIDILRIKGANIKYIVTPKHGFYATAAEHNTAKESFDIATKIPIINWRQGDHKELFQDIDVCIFDIQDSGIRYGYATTLLELLKEASAYHKKVVILDRPNVLGSYMEGSLIDTDIQGAHSIPVPVRHGMTMGELAQFFNKNLLEESVELEVVPMHNYTRQAHAAQGLPYHISPNITNPSSCYGYSFLGLLGEIGPFDIGVGTDKAFQCIMLPEQNGLSKQQWYAVRDMLKAHGVDSKFYRMLHVRKKQYYNGLKIQICDINSFSSFNTLLALLNFLKDEGIALTFSPRFDGIIGTKKIREFFQGAIPLQELECCMNKELLNFYTQAMDSFIYKPLPQLVKV